MKFLLLGEFLGDRNKYGYDTAGEVSYPRIFKFHTMLIATDMEGAAEIANEARDILLLWGAVVRFLHSSRVKGIDRRSFEVEFNFSVIRTEYLHTVKWEWLESRFLGQCQPFFPNCEYEIAR